MGYCCPMMIQVCACSADQNGLAKSMPKEECSERGSRHSCFLPTRNEKKAPELDLETAVMMTSCDAPLHVGQLPDARRLHRRASLYPTADIDALVSRPRLYDANDFIQAIMGQNSAIRREVADDRRHNFFHGVRFTSGFGPCANRVGRHQLFPGNNPTNALRMIRLPSEPSPPAL
jgi:hypothetical protein